jgi:hypothetical protein
LRVYKQMEIERFTEELGNYLNDRGWSKFISKQDLEVYAKNLDSAEGYFPDTRKSSKRRFVTLEEIGDTIKNYFINREYQEVDSMDISNSTGDTLFTSAGVQMFNRQGLQFSINKDLYIAQPVIRSQFFGLANTTKSSSTSFVNLCTERLGTNPENYIKHLNQWLDCLSSLGLYVGFMCLEPFTITGDWGKGPFRGRALRVSYKGLEIGDLGVLSNAPNLYGEGDICDAGFGLERIASAINENYKYYECMWPANIFLNLDNHQLDIIRTSTLIAGSGVRPNNNNQGYRLRKFLKEFQGFHNLETNQLIHDFYNYWGKFIKLPKGIMETQEIIGQELNRNRNLRILKELGIQEVNIGLSKGVNEFSIDLLRKK